jgi:hypothetical protein
MRPTRVALLSAALLGSFLSPVAALAVGSLPHPTVKAARDTEAVVLTGASFPTWAAPADQSVKAPDVGGAQCLAGTASECSHNTYETPEASTGAAAGAGVDIHKLLGYRWTSAGWQQIPFQVDEVATRYLTNNNSGFAAYSGADKHDTYVWDQERFRWTAGDPSDPCKAVPENGVATTPDTVPGLDTNDEIAFMASDAGPNAPKTAPMPQGMVGSYKIAVTDPYDAANLSFVYVMLAGDEPEAPKPAFDATNGYVRYHPDANSDTFVKSQSSYGSYGAAAKGPWLDQATGICHTDPTEAFQHRPLDTAWVTTPGYKFRYDGRWVMDEIHVADAAHPNTSPDESTWTYKADIIDRWKARAFQQRPGGKTPCCGYEEEQNNWGGSSILMGVRSGPVRTIRATWGSDSSTNNIRTEVFYRSEFHLQDNLRVHPIPPGDGIYAQWDFNAGKVSTYYNNYKKTGVAADGQNDEVFGNSQLQMGPGGIRFKDGDPIPVVGPQDLAAGDPGPTCSGCQFNNDIDIADPTHQGVNPGLLYEEVTGPNGTWVDRTTVKQVTPGAAYSLVTIPYYRDDSCFDDGTGSNPGLHTGGRGTDSTVDSAGQPRECWTPAKGDPANYAADHFYQGDIATHGLHIEIIADSDNAYQTQPIDEISSDQRIVLLPGERGNVGELYGRSVEKPLVAAAILESRAAAGCPTNCS